MGTAAPETNLAQNLSGIAHEPLFQVFWTNGKRMIHWKGGDVWGS